MSTRKKRYDYEVRVWMTSLQRPFLLKRILRKLVREAGTEAVTRWQLDYDGKTRTGETLGQIADRIAKELIK
jgi:hypothetical protein